MIDIFQVFHYKQTYIYARAHRHLHTCWVSKKSRPIFEAAYLKEFNFPEGGGVVTDKWYTGMLKGFDVHFREFWYIDGWVIVTYPMRPIFKLGVFWKI